MEPVRLAPNSLGSTGKSGGLLPLARPRHNNNNNDVVCVFSYSNANSRNDNGSHDRTDDLIFERGIRIEGNDFYFSDLVSVSLRRESEWDREEKERS